MADHQRSSPAAELHFAVCDRMDPNRLRAAWCLLEAFSKTYLDFLSINEGFFRKPTSPPLPLREGPPLISVFSPQGRRGNRPTRCSNRFAIRLADHQRSSPAAELHFAVCDRMDPNRLRAAWCLLEAFSKTYLDFLSINEGFFRKPTSPPLPLREGPPLISVFSPQGRRGNRPTRCSNRFAIRLADHQRSSPAAELHFAVCDRMDPNRLRAAWCLLEAFSKTYLDFLSINEGFFRKPTSPPLPLREGPPLISVFSPQGRRGNRPTRCSNRFAIRLADHQRSSPAAELHFAVCDRMDPNRLRAAWCLLEVCLVLARSFFENPPGFP